MSKLQVPNECYNMANLACLCNRCLIVLAACSKNNEVEGVLQHLSLNLKWLNVLKGKVKQAKLSVDDTAA